MRIIKINIESHFPDDHFYTYYKTMLFYTNELLSNEYIKNILDNIKTKTYEDKENYCYGVKEIDEKDLVEKLMKYGIHPLDIDLEYEYDIE